MWVALEGTIFYVFGDTAKMLSSVDGIWVEIDCLFTSSTRVVGLT